MAVSTVSIGAFLRNLCATCGLDEKFCPRHRSHIELPTPVYNPLFFNQMPILLRSLCLYCHHSTQFFGSSPLRVQIKVDPVRLIARVARVDNMFVNGKSQAESDDDLRKMSCVLQAG